MSAKKYKELNMGPFIPSEKQVLKNYFEIPLDVIEDSEISMEWASEASFVK